MGTSSSKLDFWESRSLMAENSGTDDFPLAQLEEQLLLSKVPSGAHVLDAGCGDGALLSLLAAERSCTGLGIDFSEGFVRGCQERNSYESIEFRRLALQELDVLETRDFDVVLTKRALINLDSWQEQEQAIRQLFDLVTPGGRLLLLECTVEGLDRLNELRSCLGLELMTPPWHNRFMHEPDLESLAGELGGRDWSLEEFASTYYLASRVFYAKLAQDNGEHLRYDSALNMMSLGLPNIGNLGAPRLYEIPKPVH
jgi:SAM-dependent methyltransferase